MERYQRKYFASRVNEIRSQLDMTQKEFAASVNISSSMVSDMEKGNAAPSMKVINLIKVVHNIRDEFIEKGTGDIFNYNK